MRSKMDVHGTLLYIDYSIDSRKNQRHTSTGLWKLRRVWPTLLLTITFTSSPLPIIMPVSKFEWKSPAPASIID